MTVTSRQRSDFTNHLHQRLDLLSRITDQDAEVQAWIGSVRTELDAFDGGEWEGTETPWAVVHPSGESSTPARHRLSSEIVADQLVRYSLDGVVVHPGWTVQLGDLGRLRVNVVMQVVTGWIKADRSAFPEYEPILGRIMFSANVHCPRCGQFGSHRIEIPNSPWERWAPLWRLCDCGNRWRQYPASA